MVNYPLEQIYKSAKKNPQGIAYIADDEKITYAQLISSAESVADCLLRQGTSPVVVFGQKSVDIVVSIVACLMAGRAYVPVESTMPIERVNKIIKKVGAELVVSEKSCDFSSGLCYTLSQLSKFRTLEKKKQNNNLAYIIFTSGSTGEPKGVPISYLNLENFCRWISSISPLDSYKNAVVLNHSSFSFDLSVADFYYSMCNSHTLVALTNENKANIERCTTIIKNQRVNIMVMTPTSAKMYLLDKNFNTENLPTINCIYFCGEILEPTTANKLLHAFPNLKIINAYGPTEATSAVSASIIDKHLAESDIPLPLGDAERFATEIFIEDGEIILKGASVFSGYLGQMSDRCYVSNGENCYRTGDCGYIENNRLYCCGRKDRQVKYMGYRIELDDVERNINKIAGVESCAVVAKRNEKQVVKKITAYIIVSSCEIDGSFIKSELKKCLPLYMIPKTIKIIESLPVNQNGKIDRKALSLL